jgi:hypothetical protein
MDGERVRIAVEGSTTAGVFTPDTPDSEEAEESILCLVMPLRLTDDS